MYDTAKPPIMRDRYLDEVYRKPGLGRQIWDHRTDYLYILPALAAMMLVIAYPIYYTIELSFYRTPPNLMLSDKIFVGFDNYQTILTSPVFWRVTWNTMLWTFFSTVVAFLLGLGAALSLDGEFRGRALLRAIFLIPWVISAVAASYVWRWLYHSDYGAIGAFLVQVGLTERPLNFIDNVQTSLASLIVVSIWKDFSFAMIMLMAGLQTVPQQLVRAARVDGASTWQRFWHVTAPHMKGVAVVTALLLMVQNFNNFIIPWIMTGGGPAGSSDIWITHIYQLAFGRQRWGVAAAYSVLLFVFLMSLGYFYVRALTKGDERRAEG